MPPGKLVMTGNVADNWKVWKQMWSNYMFIAQLKTQPLAYKVTCFSTVSVSLYVCALCTPEKTDNFCDCMWDAIIRDRLILGFLDHHTMGHLLMNKGLRTDPVKVELITKMPNPQDLEGIHRFNGFVKNNYLSKFLPTVWSHWTDPSPDQEQDQAFTSVQRLLTEAPVLCYYDPSLDLTIQCDVSQSGLGYFRTASP